MNPRRSSTLTQVLVNLLANASKFGPGGQRAPYRRPRRTEGLEFWVEDEGFGPSDPTDGALFEQFHRSGGEKDPDESGLGLGPLHRAFDRRAATAAGYFS